MFDWLTDLFSPETFNTIQSGFKAAAPLINTGATIASGIEGVGNQRNLRSDIRGTVGELNEMFSPTGAYAQELRNQLERKDAAAGRRSQYGTRETQLMAQLAQERSRLLSNPQYQALLTGANRSPYSPLTGALGKLSNLNTARNIPSNVETLLSLFGGSGTPMGALGGASSALGAGGLGEVGLTGAEGLSGLSGLLPSYGEAGGPQAAGLFDGAALTGAGGDLAAAGLGGAGSALAGGIGSGLGTGFGVASPTAGLAGLLPGYAGTGATGLFGGGVGGASSLFGGGSAGAAGAAGAGGAASGAGGGASAGLGGLGAAAGAALPAAVLLGGLLSMFQAGTSPEDIGRGLAANQGNLNQGNFRQFQAENPYLNALVEGSMTDGQFDLNKYSQMAQRSNVGGKQFTGQALQDVLGFGQAIQQNPGWMQGPAATQEAWWSPYTQGQATE